MVHKEYDELPPDIVARLAMDGDEGALAFIIGSESAANDKADNED